MAKRISYSNNAILAGTPGADFLKAYGDFPTLDGGAGNDTYFLADNYYYDSSSVDGAVIIEQAGGGTADKVVFEGDRYNYDGHSLAENVENLSLVGYADYGNGNEAGNVIDASGARSGYYGNIDLFGYGGNDTLIGSNYDDSLFGGTGNDTLNGGRGDDGIYGNDGNDLLNGGYGNDGLYGGSGNDILNGGDSDETALSDFGGYGFGGDDTLYGNDGNDVLNGGNDTLSSNGYGAELYAGDDMLVGGDGNDVLNGGNDTLLVTDASSYAGVMYGGHDTLYGGDGNDILNGGDDRMIGGNGSAFGGNESFYASRDTFYGGYGNDTINIGDSFIQGNGGNDGIYGGYGYAHGGDGNDTINGGVRTHNGGDGDDVVFAVGEDTGDGNFFIGGYGNDIINGGSITLLGGNGSDMLYGAMPSSYYGDQWTSSDGNDGDGNDTIRGLTETIDGGAGDDYIYAGYSTYYGGGGNDVITGGAETILGGTGNDRVFLNGTAFNSMFGGDGNDTLTAGTLTVNLGNGENHLYGDYGYGVGYANLYGNDGNDILNGASASDALDGGDGNDTLNGNAGNDRLYGGAGNDVLNGGAGNDVLVGGYGGDIDNDVLNGGAGDDLYYVSYYGGVDTIAADPGGDDTVMVYQETFTAAAGIENILENSGFGDNFFTGNASDNFIYGGNGDDVLVGLAGNDVLDGGSGADRMEGGAGNDSYIVDNGRDVVVEALGAGTDSVFVDGYGYGRLGANLENMTLGHGAYGTTIFGNNLNNVLMGNSYNNTIYGGAGNDTLADGYGSDALFGGAGNDTYIVHGYYDDSVFELSGGGTADTVRSLGGSFTLGSYVENLVIVSSNNGYTATGNDLANRIEGGAGSDSLYSGEGNVAFVDTLIGGAGNDYYTVDSLTDVVTEAAGGGTTDWVNVDTVSTLGTFTLAANVEGGALMGAGNLNLTGNVSDNQMYGNGGANVLDGGAGNDGLFGNNGNDTLLGGAGDDYLHGMRGNDRMEGGLGNDTYVVDRGDGAGTAIAANEDVVVDTGGIDLVYSRVYSYTLDAPIENLTLESNGVARKGIGNALNNIMYGNNLANVLDGGDGNDMLFGNAGNDSLTGGNGNDLLDAGSGTDTLNGGGGNDTFTIVAGVYTNQAVNTVVTGGSGIDTVNFSGGYFNLPFYPDRDEDGFTLGADLENLNLSGWADFGNGNALDNVIDASGAYSSYYGDMDLYGDAGNDTLIGSQYGDRMYGGDGNDILKGNQGTDQLYGAAGNDNLQGGDGNTYDFLDGGDGNDTMAGGRGGDTYEVDAVGDVILEDANAGFDWMRIKAASALTLTMAANVEGAWVSGSYGFDEGHDITGNLLDNDIYGDDGDNTIAGGAGNDFIFAYGGADSLSGDAGDDRLFGNGGTDTLNGGTGNDFLDGGLGNDSMVGGAGDDVYRVSSSSGSETVTEAALGGTDRVEISRSSGITSYTLPGEVENLGILGTGTAITATGNGLANVFTIGELTNLDSFNGLLGSDTLNARIIHDDGGDGSVTLAGIENVNLYVQFQSDANWTIDAGNVAGQVLSINGYVYDTASSLVVNGLAASHTVVLGDGPNLFNDGSPGGTIELNLQSGEALNIVLAGFVDSVNLAATDVNAINFTVRGDSNAINVLNVINEDALHFTGESRALTVNGLTNGDTIQLQNFAAEDLNLFLSDSYGGSDSLNIELDNVVITGNGLNTDDQFGFNGLYGLENLNITSDGGASYLDGGGIGLTTDVVLIGGSDLTLENFGGDDFDASGFGGNLAGNWGNGNTYFTAGVGDDNINLGNGFDTLDFGVELDSNDVVNGGGDTDTLLAEFGAGTHVLHIVDVENVNLTLTGGAIEFDLGEVSSTNVTFAGSAASVKVVTGDANYTINAGALTSAVNIVTGSSNDTLIGGAGNDTLNSGELYDNLTGGAGNDNFVFDNLNVGYDYLTDFTGAGVAGGDVLQLSLSVFGDIGTVGSAMTGTAFVANVGAIAGDADDRILYDTSNGFLYYDGDGNGAEGAILFAIFASPVGLAAQDISVIA